MTYESCNCTQGRRVWWNAGAEVKPKNINNYANFVLVLESKPLNTGLNESLHQLYNPKLRQGT